MSDNIYKFRISGRVIDRKSSCGIAGLSIEVCEKGWSRNKPVGGDTTDRSGAFKIMNNKVKGRTKYAR